MLELTYIDAPDCVRALLCSLQHARGGFLKVKRESSQRYLHPVPECLLVFPYFFHCHGLDE